MTDLEMSPEQARAYIGRLVNIEIYGLDFESNGGDATRILLEQMEELDPLCSGVWKRIQNASEARYCEADTVMSASGKTGVDPNFVRGVVTTYSAEHMTRLFSPAEREKYEQFKQSSEAVPVREAVLARIAADKALLDTAQATRRYLCNKYRLPALVGPW